MIRQAETLPGRSARKLLQRFCSGATMERVFDPFVADLQAEWLAEKSSGRIAYARWRLCNAYCALVVQIIVSGFGALGGRALAPASASHAAASIAAIEAPRSRWFRYCGPLAFASLITFGLFVLMSVLITQQSVRVLDPVPPIIQITRARLIPDSTPVPPKVVLPQKPVKEEKIFNEPIKVPGPTGYSRRFISAPGTGGEIAIPGVQVKINAVAVSDRNATPIVRVNPVYPAAQAQRNVEGWVEVEFTITATGSVSDPRVTSAEPRGAFDRAALHAIERWKYEPMLVNGKPTAQSGVRTRLLFELN